MNFNVEFKEINSILEADFGEVHVLGADQYEIGYNNGYTKGYSVGYAEGELVGKTQGYSEGYSKGHNDGYSEGNQVGYDEGYSKGYAEGYSKGYSEGYNVGKAEGVIEGKKSADNEFWDLFQQNGNRTNYQSAFAGYGWTVDTFKPKYSIVAINNNKMQANEIFKYSKIRADLGKVLSDKKLTIDFSTCTNSDQMFIESSFTALPVLDFRNITSTSYLTFYSCSKLTKIEKLMINDNGNQQFNSSFNGCSALTDITFSGVIGQNISFSSSPLNKASIENIIGCLSISATGKTLTLKKSAVNTAFGINVDDETTYPEGSEYYELRHSKDNWTISYV